jgi:hypothetical protein
MVMLSLMGERGADWLEFIVLLFRATLNWTSVKVKARQFCPRTLLCHLNLSGTFSIMFARQALRPVTLLTNVCDAQLPMRNLR